MRYISTLLISFLLSLQVTNAKSMLLDRVDAIVGDEVILRSQLIKFKTNFNRRKQIDPLLVMTSEEKLTTSYLLELLIRERLISQYLNKHSIEVTDEMVNQQILQIQTANNLTRTQLKQALELEGYNFSDYYQHMKSSLKTNSFIERELRPKIRITQDDLKNEYFKTYIGKSLPIKYRISHIYLDTSSYKTRSDAVEFMRSIRNRILAGENFSDLAKAYSQGPAAETGGDLGVLSLENLSSELASAAAKMKIGEVSQIINSSSGVHLIRLSDKVAGTNADFQEKKDELQNKIYRKRLVQLLEDWFQNKKKDTYVKAIPI